MLQVRKVIEHVYEKVMGNGSDKGSEGGGGGGAGAPPSTSNGHVSTAASENGNDQGGVFVSYSRFMYDDGSAVVVFTWPYLRCV